jgi:HEAT repeat protein
MPYVSRENHRKRGDEMNTSGDVGRLTGAAAESVSDLVASLFDGDPGVRRRAAASLAALADDNVMDALIPLWGCDQACVRNLAVEIMGRIGPKAVPKLTGLLTHKDKEIRKFAVDALKGVGETEAEDPLIRALADEDVNVAAAAAEALSVVGTARAVPFLAAALQGHTWLACAALKALGEIGGDEALLAVLSMEAPPDEMTLFCKIGALERIGSPKALPYLLSVLEGASPQMTPHLIQAVVPILGRADSADVEAAKAAFPPERVRGLLGHPHRGVVRNAIVLLGLYRDRDAAQDIARMYKSGGQDLFQEIETALRSIGPVESDALLRILEDPMESEAVKISVVRLLGKLGDEAAANALERVLHGGTLEIKRTAISALALLKGAGALGVFHRALSDEDEEMRALAVEMLERVKDPSSVPFLLALGEDASPVVRSSAATTLRKFDLSGFLPEIRETLEGPSTDRLVFGLNLLEGRVAAQFADRIEALVSHVEPRVRSAALEALARSGKGSIAELGPRLLGDESPRVRRAAIRVLEYLSENIAGPLLLQVAATDADDWNRYEAVRSLAQRKSVALLSEALRALESPSDLIRSALLDAIGELGDASFRGYAERFADADDPQVRDAARDALEKLNQ